MKEKLFNLFYCFIQIFVITFAMFLAILVATQFYEQQIEKKLEMKKIENSKKEVTNSKKTSDKNKKKVTDKKSKNNKKKKKTLEEADEFPLLFQYRTADENKPICDYQSINAYRSFAKAQANAIGRMDGVYDLALFTDKKVRVTYEVRGKIKEIKPHNNIYTLYNLGEDYSQYDYIIQIVYKKTSFYLYVNTSTSLDGDESIDTTPSDWYMSIIAVDEYQTYSKISPIEFYDTIEEANDNFISIPPGLSMWGKNLIFYYLKDKDFKVEILSPSSDKPLKPKRKKKGNLSIFTLEKISNDGGLDYGESYIIILKLDGKTKYLDIYIE